MCVCIYVFFPFNLPFSARLPVLNPNPLFFSISLKRV